jgi:hypothetical protein
MWVSIKNPRSHHQFIGHSERTLFIPGILFVAYNVLGVPHFFSKHPLHHCGKSLNDLTHDGVS